MSHQQALSAEQQKQNGLSDEHLRTTFSAHAPGNAIGPTRSAGLGAILDQSDRESVLAGCATPRADRQALARWHDDPEVDRGLGA